jgi:putative hemolysin
VAAEYHVRRARTAQDISRVMALRIARFGAGIDEFDARATQIMVLEGDCLRATFRLIEFGCSADMVSGYSGQFYDLAGFSALGKPALELGRFCLDAGTAGREAECLRLCFAAMAAMVDRIGAALLFGCASFAGSEVGPHLPALGALKPHISPHWAVGRKNPHIIDLSDISAPSDPMAALRALPPLLRSYLGIGGWVSDHVVQDFALGTIHVFTGVEVSRIPPVRALALRALAGQIDLGQAE